MKASLSFTILILLAVSVPSHSQPQEAVRLIVQPVIRAQMRIGIRTQNSSVFSVDGKLLVTCAPALARLAGNDHPIIVVSAIDVATGLVVKSLELSWPEDILAGPVFDRKGNVLIGGGKGDIYTWDLTSASPVKKTIPALGTLTALTLSPDGTTVLAASQSATGVTVRVLDLGSPNFPERNRIVVPVKSARERVKYAEFFQDLALLEVRAPGADSNFEVWSLKEKRKIREYAVWEAHLSPDAQRLAISGSKGNVEVVNPLTGAKEPSIDDDTAPPGSPGTAPGTVLVVFSPDSKRLIRGGAKKGELLMFTAGVPQPRRLRQEGGFQEPVAVSPDGRWILASETYFTSEVATLWDAQSGAKVRTFFDRLPPEQTVAFATHSPTLLAASKSGSAIWDMSLGRLRSSLPGGATNSLLTPDGRRVISAAGSTVEVRDAESGTVTGTLQAGASNVSLDFINPEPTTLVFEVRNGRQVRLWDLKSPKEFLTIPMEKIGHLGVALSPDSRKIIVGHHVWDLDSKAEIWEVPGTKPPVDRFGTDPTRILKAFFLDARRVCVIAEGPPMTVRVWDLDTHKELSSYPFESQTIVPQVVPSRDGKLVYASAGGSVVVLDAMTGKEQRRFESANSFTTSLSLSEDEKWVATATSEGVRLWEVASGRLRATIVSFLDGTWAVVDREGRYDGSDPDRSSGLHFVAGLEPIELRQLKQRFYTPGLLGRIIKGERLPDVGGKLQQLSLYPEVTVTGPVGGKIQIALKNKGGGLGRVVVKVNGREISPDTWSKGLNPTAPTASIEVNVAGATLDEKGKNNIEVSAFDAGAVVSSRSVNVVYNTPPPASTEKPRFFAILSGVSQFAGGSMNLGFAAKDAEDMANALRAGASRMLGAENVFIQILSTTGHPGTVAPTKANLAKAFADVRDKAKSTDVLVVYFAGHGMSSPGEDDSYYYLTQEARSGDIHDKAVRDIATVSVGELKTWIMAIKTVKVVVALDTCAAGAASQQLLALSEKRALTPDQMRAIELLKDSVGSFILMGSAADAVSYEANKYGQGLMTYALLKGMKGESLVEGHRLEVAKWFTDAQREVEVLAKDIGGVQRPILSAPNSVSFPIAEMTPADKDGIKLASVKTQLLRINCNDDNDLDPLKLTTTMRQNLRNPAYLTARSGGSAKEAPFVYLDGVTDDVAGAVTPRVRYQGSGAEIQVRITLIRDGAPVGAPLTLPAPANAEKASDQIVDAISKALSALK